MPKIFTNFDKFNREIYYGDNYVAIAKNVERAIIPPSSYDKQVQILDSELLLTICSNCTVLLHYDLLYFKLINNGHDAISPGQAQISFDNRSSLRLPGLTLHTIT